MPVIDVNPIISSPPPAQRQPSGGVAAVRQETWLAVSGAMLSHAGSSGAPPPPHVVVVLMLQAVIAQLSCSMDALTGFVRLSAANSSASQTPTCSGAAASGTAAGVCWQDWVHTSTGCVAVAAGQSYLRYPCRCHHKPSVFLAEL
jgi:hypothetical protein